jgi:2-dehydropantoate 2-reductase
MTNIAILGAGAIGSILGALLNRQGQEVTLISRPEHVRLIQTQGLQVEGAFGDFTIQVPAAEALDFQPEVAFLTMKTQDVVSAMQANREFLEHALVVTFQNGLRSDDLVAELLPAAQIVSCVVIMSASYLTPGMVSVFYPGALVVGRPAAAVDRTVEDVAAILRQAVPTKVSSNIIGAHWLKLLINLNNALPALTDLSLAQVYADPYLRWLVVGLMREGLRTAQMAGVRLESLPETPAMLIRLLGLLPAGLASRMLALSVRRVERLGPFYGSTHQSLQRGRSTEIDYLNGEVARLGAQLGVATPLNAGVLRLVHQVEKTGEFFSADALRNALQEGNNS